MQNFTEKLMNWDTSYYAQKQQQALFNLTDEDVRPYFAYPTVLAGLHKVLPLPILLPSGTCSVCLPFKLGLWRCLQSQGHYHLMAIYRMHAADWEAVQCHPGGR